MRQSSTRLGILGGGQLGRMLCEAAQDLDITSVVFDTNPQNSACQIADEIIIGDFKDREKIKQFIWSVDVVILEFENIPLSTVHQIEKEKPVFPSSHFLEVTQNRWKEKDHFTQLNIPTPNYEKIKAGQPAPDFSYPAILKTASGGYDGHGQFIVSSQEECQSVLNEHPSEDFILEQKINLLKEFSVIGCLDRDNNFIHFPMPENKHRDGILLESIVPADIDENIETQAVAYAKKIADSFKVKGLFCVEFFLDEHNNIFANEIAPRVHNSGHYTQFTYGRNQFHIAIQALFSMPIEKEEQPYAYCGMVNLLGHDHYEQKFNDLITQKSCLWHYDYCKEENRLHRKMGHVNFHADSREVLEAQQSQFIQWFYDETV